MSRVVIGAGGTGGHVLPGLLTARALVAGGMSPDDVVFVGGRGPEGDAVRQAGHRFVSLPVRGARRPLRHPANVAVAAGMGWAALRCAALMRRERIRSVLSIGGFAGVPVALAAAMTRRRLVLFEPNARPGRANWSCRRLAAAVGVPFSEFGTPFGSKAVTVGPLVRSEIWAGPADAPARAALGLPPGGLVVGLFGGSQGAQRLNRALLGCYPAWRDRADLSVVHVTGPRNLAAAQEELAQHQRESDAVRWRLLGWSSDMAAFWAAADVVVCRSGASTLAEALATATPTVMVPGEFAEGHQRDNAAVAVTAGAAVTVPDSELDPARLLAELTPLLASPSRREAMSRAARSLAGEPGAGEARLAALVLGEEPR